MRPGAFRFAASPAADAGSVSGMQPQRRLSADRRWVGAAVLVCALLVVAAASRFGAPGVRGQAVAAWPQPPAVGSCLNTGRNGGDVVPCSQPHEAEVTRSFAASDPLLNAETSAFDGQMTRRFFELCSAAANDYLGLPGTAMSDEASGSADATPSGTSSPPALVVRPSNFAVSAITAPPAERVGELGWAVCVVQPSVPAAYTGTVRALGQRPVEQQHLVQRIPAAYGTCFNSDRNAPNGDVSCTSDHRGQTLATAFVTTAASAAADLTIGTSPLVSAVTAQCRQIAAAQLGAADPTYGGALTVAVLVGPGTVVFNNAETTGPAGSSAANTPVAQYQVALSCVVSPDGDGTLTDSVLGWGERPPPLG